MLSEQDSPPRSVHASTQHWCFAFPTCEDLSQLTVSKSRYQSSVMPWGFEKSTLPPQSNLQEVQCMLRTAWKWSCHFHKILRDISSTKNEHWATHLCDWNPFMHAATCFHTFWGSSGIPLTIKPGIWTLNFTEISGYRISLSLQV